MTEQDEASTPRIHRYSIIRKTVSGHASCIFRCQKPNGLRNVPIEKRTGCLIDHSIFIPRGARCCRNHLLTQNEDWEHPLPVIDSCLTSSEYDGAIHLLHEPTKKLFSAPFFPVATSDNEDFYAYWTGLSIEHFLSLMDAINNHKLSLAMTPVKLRKNYSFDDLTWLTDLSCST